MDRIVGKGLRPLLSGIIIKKLDNEGLLSVRLSVTGLDLCLRRRGAFLDGMIFAFIKLSLVVFVLRERLRMMGFLR